MSRDRAYLEDMLDSASLIVEYLAGKTREDLAQSVLLQDAVVRRFGIIGEAARRLADSTRQALPGVPWRAVSGMRNVLIHDYDKVDFDTIWDTARNDLPTLITELETFLKSHPTD